MDSQRVGHDRATECKYTHTHTHTHTYIYIYTIAYIWNGLLVIKKEWNDGICDNMDESGGYYAKWYVRQRQKQV